MVPTAPGHPRFDEVDADPLGVNARLGTYTNFVNLLGWCALALPAGMTARRAALRRDLHRPGARTTRRWLDFGRRWQGARRPRRCRSATPATAPTLPIAVVGAHLSGLPLNGQLLERGATLREATRTAPQYRLFALPDTRPPKPGLQRCAEGGAAIEVEVWDHAAARRSARFLR